MLICNILSTLFRCENTLSSPSYPFLTPLPLPTEPLKENEYAKERDQASKCPVGIRGLRKTPTDRAGISWQEGAAGEEEKPYQRS